MARRWLVNTTTNRLTGVVDDDDATVFPSGRAVVYELVIRATGVPRSDIKPGGLWVIQNGVGSYTVPTPPSTGTDKGPQARHAGPEHHQELAPRGERAAGHCRRCGEPPARGLA